ncbi:MAG TPA: rhomboid family intramembrane serine protease [Sedimentisphaerales bacterium]|nr:rhomboid family intramembrane serine protease [Sedimentisphaerales bacterium]
MSDMQQMQVVLPSPKRLLTPGVVGILALSVAGYLLSVLGPPSFAGALGLSADGVLHGRIWQLLTYPFVCGSVLNQTIDCLVVLFVGSAVEREWRTASFLWLWAVVSVVCGCLWVLVSLIVGGNYLGMELAACSYGLIATMGLLYRDTRFLVFFTTVEAQHLAVGLIVMGILLNLVNPMGLIWVAGAAVAYLYVKAKWRHAAPRQSCPTSRGGRGPFVELD